AYGGAIPVFQLEVECVKSQEFLFDEIHAAKRPASAALRVYVIDIDDVEVPGTKELSSLDVGEPLGLWGIGRLLLGTFYLRLQIFGYPALLFGAIHRIANPRFKLGDLPGLLLRRGRRSCHFLLRALHFGTGGDQIGCEGGFSRLKRGILSPSLL